MKDNERLLQRKEKLVLEIASAGMVAEYEAYLPEMQDDEELAFHYFTRDSILGLKKRRMLKGFTQAEMADKMGTKQTAISRFENYNSEPTIKFLFKYAKAMGENLNIISCGDFSLLVPEQIVNKASKVFGNDQEYIKESLVTILDAAIQTKYEYSEILFEAYSTADMNSSIDYQTSSGQSEVL